MKRPVIRKTTQQKRGKYKQPTPIPIVLIFACIVCLMITVLAIIQASAGFSDLLPFSLHSLLESDYSADPHNLRISAVSLSLIRDAIGDSSGFDAADRFATLQANLNTSVPTVTPSTSTTPSSPTPTLQQPTATRGSTYSEPTPTSQQPTSTYVPTQMLPSPTFSPWIPTSTSRPHNPTKQPDEPDPTKPPPPPPTNPPPTNPPATKPPPPPTKAPPPPSNPYPPAYP
jgi:hypothetical protein